MGLIMEKTRQRKVNYIGYAMGTTQIFYGLSQLESVYYGHYINKLIALAPCIYYYLMSYQEYVEDNVAYRNLGQCDRRSESVEPRG